MNTEIICRLCVSKTEKTNSIEIFSENGRFLNISNIVTKYLWFGVKPNDTLQSICKRCWKNILNFHHYYKSIEIAQHAFYENYVKLKSSPLEELITNPEIDIKYNCNNAVVEVFNVEGKEEATDKSTVKITNPFECVVINNDDNIHTSLDYKDFEDDYKNLELHLINKTECSEDNKNIAVNGSYVKTVKMSSEDEMIQNYFDMNCDLCDAKFPLFGDARQHYKRIHKKLGYITCCKKKYYRRGKIVEHILYHQNPLSFQCKTCNKTFSNGFGLSEHTKNRHDPMTKKSYKCDICTKVFTKQNEVNRHKIIFHSLDPEKCEICSRTFVHKSLLKAHIRQVHELANTQICDICAKTFTNASSYDYHRYVEHSDEGELKKQCNICGTWLKHERNYLVHMKRHEETGETCQYCGKSTANKKAMNNHIKRHHLNLNVETYACTICNKVLKSAQSLKEHMPQHTGDTLYSCTWCEKRFNSNANMYAHRKRAHPKEYAENKGLRTKLLTQNEKMK